MKQLKVDSAELTITMVPHGYQLDIDVYFKGEAKGTRAYSGCRDFSGSLKTQEDWIKSFSQVQKALDRITQKKKTKS